MRGLHRLAAVAFSVAFVAVVVAPVFGDPPRDSFPLSTYPMFSRPKRGDPTVVQVLGRPAQGEPRILPPAALGTDEVLQAVVTVKRAVYRGRARQLCRSIARRIAPLAAFQDVRSVDIVSAAYDPIRYFTADGPPVPSRRHRHARCPVKR